MFRHINSCKAELLYVSQTSPQQTMSASAATELAVLSDLGRFTLMLRTSLEETITPFRMYTAKKDEMKDWRDFCFDFLVIYNIYPHSYHGSQTSRYLTITPPELSLAVHSEPPPAHTFILSLFADILMIYLLQTWIIYNKITILVIQSSCFYTTVIIPCSSLRDPPHFSSDNWKGVEFFWKTLPHWYRGCCSRQNVWSDNAWGLVDPPELNSRKWHLDFSRKVFS